MQYQGGSKALQKGLSGGMSSAQSQEMMLGVMHNNKSGLNLNNNRGSLNGNSNVSPIMTSSKLNNLNIVNQLHKPHNYHSQNSASEVSTSQQTLNVSNNDNATSISNNGVGSGSNTPSGTPHLSQQNLIKIMKKIKSSGGSGSNSTNLIQNHQSNNKENQAVMAPNIMLRQTSGSGPANGVGVGDLHHGSGSTTPTEQHIYFQNGSANGSTGGLAGPQKGDYKQNNYHSNPSASSVQTLPSSSQPKKIISITKLSNVRSSKEGGMTSSHSANLSSLASSSNN